MKVWNSDKYYKKAKEGSVDVKHFGMKQLKELSKTASTILDMGCGEGTRLGFIGKGKKGYGVDISKKAISLAKINYPGFNFRVMNLEKLKFENEMFDLVYSAYVLEHLENPQKVIEEAIRVTKKGGKICFIAPNYGAPNRSSPVFKGSRLKKIINGFVGDIKRLFIKENTLDWTKVEPIDSVDKYVQDLDTTIEPYLGSLVSFLETKNLEISVVSSCWEEELPQAKIIQKIFRFLGGKNLYPFKYWGPHLVLIVNKN